MDINLKIEKHLKEISQIKIIRYFFVGGISAFIDISLFAIFANYMHYSWVTVSLTSFIFVTLINYYLSMHYVFKVSKRNHQIIGVFIISSIALILNQFLLYFFIELIKINLMTSKFLTTGIVFFWSYYGRKKYVF
jgi:putative flippase GtrA